MVRSATLLWLGLAVVLLVTTARPVMAQEPTPTEPGPTPIVTGDYVIRQELTYGDGGVMLALLFVGGVLLLSLLFRVAEKVMGE